MEIMTKKIMTVFGTRPEAIKMAPVVKALAADPDLEPITVVTGQHREMLQQVLDIFDLTPDFDLKVMEKRQTLTSITTKVLTGLGPILESVHPNMVLVHGDTTTTMAAAMASFYHRTILLTMHRRENQGEKMEEALTAIRQVVEERGDVDLVYPVHLSPAVQEVAHRVFDGVHNVYLIDPLDVVDFHNLAARSYLIMTDSGGIQEEAPSLNRPVLVLRDSTERPEGVRAGTLKLVGTDPARIKAALNGLLEDPLEYTRMATAANPYGNGHAAEAIVKAIKDYGASV